MKKCPFCAEEIQDEAIKCKHCGEFLDEIPVPEPKSKVPWYCRTSTIVLAFLVAGPLALPLVWIHPSLDRHKKTVITIAVLVISYFLYLACVKAMQTLDQYYQMML